MVGATVGWDGTDVPVLRDVSPDPECLRSAPAVPPEVVLQAADPDEMPGQWVDAGMSAWFRAQNRAAWQQARWVWEAARSRAGTSERVEERARSGKIVAASLGWSEGYAQFRVEFSRQVLERLPALGDAMRAGVLEERKALIFTSTLEDLDDAQARVVVDRLLSSAPQLAFARLRTRVEQTAQAVDPTWAAVRRAAAVARRRVGFRVAPSGGADLCGLDLPEEAAQDAHDRIVALGRVVRRRLRAAGVTAPIGPIESEVMLTLTGPAGAGLWDVDVVEHVVARFGGPPTDPGDGPDGDGPDGDGPDEHGPDEHGPDEHGPDDHGPDDHGPDDGSPDEHGPDDGPSDDDGASGSGEAAEIGRPTGDRPTDIPAGSEHAPAPGASGHGCAEARGDGAAPAPGDAAGTPGVVPFVPRVALRVGLCTLVGLDRRPGEIPCRGVVSSAVAVSMAWARTAGSWRLLLYDDQGVLEHVLSIRPPAHGPPPLDGRRRHHVVEVTARTAELDALRTAPGPARGAALDSTPGPGLRGRAGRDLVAGPGPVARGGDGLVPGDAYRLLERAVRALATARDRPDHEHPAHTLAEAGHRFPGAAMRAWVQARDRSCRAPGCAAEAVGCDIDHTRDWQHGGRTVAGDLGVFCRRDHLFKHDPDTGWTVTQTRAGYFTWAAPTGRVHVVVPELHDPLPDPVPTADGTTSTPAGLLDPPPAILPPGRPRPNRHGLITREAKATAARLRRRAEGCPEPQRTADPDEPPF